MAKTKVPTSASLGSGIPVGDFIAPISKEVASRFDLSYSGVCRRSIRLVPMLLLIY